MNSAEFRAMQGLPPPGSPPERRATKGFAGTPLLAMDGAAPFQLEGDAPEAPELCTTAGGIYETTFFLHTKTPGNSRKHWQHEARAAKRQRGMVSNRLTLHKNLLPPLPIRYSMGRIDKWNLGGAFKHIIDGIADAYEVDDRRDDLYDFVFDQAKAPRGVHKVTLKIEPQTK
jgi:hypothetical protein